MLGLKLNHISKRGHKSYLTCLLQTGCTSFGGTLEIPLGQLFSGNLGKSIHIDVDFYYTNCRL